MVLDELEDRNKAAWSFWFFVLHFLGEHVPLSLMMYYQITSGLRLKKLCNEFSDDTLTSQGKEDDEFFLIMNQDSRQRKKAVVKGTSGDILTPGDVIVDEN
jgi:hypothetical protein